MTTPCPACGYTGKRWPGKGTPRLGALVVRLVAYMAHMEVGEILARDQAHVYILARAACAKIMRVHAELKWKQIGVIMARNHSTIINSDKHWEDDEVLRIEVGVLEIMRRNMQRPIA